MIVDFIFVFRFENIYRCLEILIHISGNQGNQRVLSLHIPDF